MCAVFFFKLLIYPWKQVEITRFDSTLYHRKHFPLPSSPPKKGTYYMPIPYHPFTPKIKYYTPSHGK